MQGRFPHFKLRMVRAHVAGAADAGVSGQVEVGSVTAMAGIASDFHPMA
jgi:hypothetical protein